MILAHNSTQYLNFKIFAGLANKITYSLGKVTLQNMVAILRHPYEMIFNFILGMAACSIFHTKEYKTTAGLKLPA